MQRSTIAPNIGGTHGAASRTGGGSSSQTRRVSSSTPAWSNGRRPATELAVVRQRYRAEVEAAIRAAFDALDNPRDRNLLRLYYLEHVGLEQLGQMFGVHGSTVSRWLAALRETIVEATRGYLAERLGPAGNFAEIDSLIRAVQSDLDLTLSRILGPK